MRRYVKKLQLRLSGVLALLAMVTSAGAYAQEPEAAHNPAATSQARSAVPSPETVNRILGQISEITGMKLKHPVPMSTLTKEEWRRWVEERVKESAKPEEIEALASSSQTEKESSITDSQT